MRIRSTTLVITVVMILALYVAGYLLHPKPVRASHLIETPGIIFAPTVVYPGQHVRMCANNFLADGSARWLLEFRSHDDANKVLASSGFVTLAPQNGACLDADASDLLKAGSAAGLIGDGQVGIIGVLRAERGSSTATRSFPLTSFQTCPSDPHAVLTGKCSSMLPALQSEALLLPAVIPQ